MEGLVVQLDNYSRLGIPKLHHLAVFPDPAEDLVEEGKIPALSRDINSMGVYSAESVGGRGRHYKGFFP